MNIDLLKDDAAYLDVTMRLIDNWWYDFTKDRFDLVAFELVEATASVASEPLELFTYNGKQFLIFYEISNDNCKRYLTLDQFALPDNHHFDFHQNPVFKIYRSDGAYQITFY